MNEHSTILEWLFLVMSVFTFVEAINALRTAMIDHAVFVGKKIDGGLRSTASSNVQMGWFFIAISVLMLGVSILTVLLPPPPPDYQNLPQSEVMIVGWIMLGMLLVVASLLSKSSRRHLTKYSRQEHQETTYITESPAESGQPLNSPTEGNVVEGRRSSDPKPIPKETP